MLGRRIQTVLVVLVITAMALAMVALTIEPDAFRTVPDQPSPSKQDYPLNFKPFLTAKLNGPGPIYLTRGGNFPRVNHVSSDSIVAFKVTVTNDSDEGIWSNDHVSVMLTARDDQGSFYSSDELGQFLLVVQRYAKDDPSRLLIGSLPAHQATTKEIDVDVPKLPRAVRQLCFRLNLAMDAGLGQPPWQKSNAAEACVKVVHK